MNDTPRTNSIPRRGPFHHYVVEDVLEHARQLEREVAMATDVITKCNKWIEEAKPLLERGGTAERTLEKLRQLTKALLEYARHAPTCPMPAKECDCGLKELLKELE